MSFADGTQVDTTSFFDFLTSTSTTSLVVVSAAVGLVTAIASTYATRRGRRLEAELEASSYISSRGVSNQSIEFLAKRVSAVLEMDKRATDQAVPGEAGEGGGGGPEERATESAGNSENHTEHGPDVRPNTDQARSQATINVLNRYSAQGLVQSRISFFCSIIFAALGFFIIVFGIVAAVQSTEPTILGALVPVIGGAIVEGVSALFFSVNIRAQKVVVSYFDKLREDRRLEEALQIAEGLGDSEVGQRLKAVLAMKFIEIRDMSPVLEQLTGVQMSAAARSHVQGADVAAVLGDGKAQVS